MCKTKTDADGNVERCKPHQFACGNEQQTGVDYNDATAPYLTGHSSPDADSDELLDAAQVKAHRTLSGSLLWLARYTRPNIAFAAQQMTRCTSPLRIADMRPGKRDLRHLVGATSMMRCMKPGIRHALILSAYAYADADYGDQGSYGKSISTVIIHLNAKQKTSPSPR